MAFAIILCKWYSVACTDFCSHYYLWVSTLMEVNTLTHIGCLILTKGPRLKWYVSLSCAIGSSGESDTLEWNKVKYITWWHLIRQVQRGGPVQWCDLYESYNWWNSILLTTLKNLFVCQWNHLTRPPSRKLCSQISTVSNEMQVHQLSFKWDAG